GSVGIRRGGPWGTLPVYAGPEDIDYVLAAIELVADRGGASLPLYELGWRDGVWTHREWRPREARLELSAASLAEAVDEPREVAGDDVRGGRARKLADARSLALRLRQRACAWGASRGGAHVDALGGVRSRDPRPP